MKNLLEKAGLSFARAFGAALIVLIPGILAAPNTTTALAAGMAMLFAALTAGFKAVQVFVPQLTTAAFIPQPYAAWVDSFGRAFFGTLITLLVGYFGVINGPDINGLRAAVVAALVGAVSAGFRALQGTITKGEQPAPNTGA